MKKIQLYAGLVSAGILVAGCNTNKTDDSTSLVECNGVGNNNTSVMMTKDMCSKLPATSQTEVDSKDYVACYGVAAAGKNDCANDSVSCSGNIKVARAKDAFVTLPKGVCANLQGSSTTPSKK
jgi:uncharacterized membrane protein